MFNKNLIRWFVILVLVSYWTAIATASGDPLDELLQISGINEQVREFPAQVKGQMDAEVHRIPIQESHLKEMRNLVDEFMDTDVIVKTARERLRESLSDDELQELMVWYKSDLGRKTTLAEVESSKPGKLARALEQAEELMADLERVEFAKSVFEITGGKEAAMAVANNTQIMVVLIIAAVLAPGEPLDLDLVKAQLVPMRQFLEASVEQFGILTGVYIYQNFSMDELNQYLKFLESPVSKKFGDVISEAIIESLEQYVADLMEYSKTLEPTHQVPQGAI